MEVTVEQLFAHIGRLTVELELAREVNRQLVERNAELVAASNGDHELAHAEKDGASA